MQDLSRLDDYLCSEESPEDCLMLSDLDGFLHGVACSPVTIPVAEWMAKALGGLPGETPPWVAEAVGARFIEILDRLNLTPPMVEPIFWEAKEGHVIAMDWCEGFMEAIGLRPQEWLRLTESGTAGRLITPILVHLIDDQGNSVLGISQEDLDETLDAAADAIPETVGEIYRFWQTA
ncbi:YecA family protein [Defluviimonas sp. WL0075]|uniref:YecA family protein n=1 Tax=Albidovulum sediminicola TaxID=2984331 RepID=A0ABT2Z6R3_9RHOB|nr:YecA family protein [Defluviimonas sp. WL0075]MCV2866829.1 YecA family protein [Defluviimonas sp. WL0075]